MNMIHEAEQKLAICLIHINKNAHGITEMLDREKAQIQHVCDANNWKPIFYESISKHHNLKWIAVDFIDSSEEQLQDPNVVALVVQSFSSLPIGVQYVAYLMGNLDALGVELVIASSSDLNLMSNDGRVKLEDISLGRELYAEVIAERTKWSIQYRKQRGITVGMPPFGAKRNTEGYLIASTEGIWLLSDGTWQSGENTDSPPDKEAVWHGYFECTKRIFELYTSKHSVGYAGIAKLLQDEGWMFRTRRGEPRPIEPQDVRRVIDCKAQYGGAVDSLSEYYPERALLPMDLIKSVEHARNSRNHKR
jgi:hypothetical protein